MTGVNYHCYFSDAVVTLNVLTASNNEAEKLVETRTVHFA